MDAMLSGLFLYIYCITVRVCACAGVNCSNDGDSVRVRMISRSVIWKRLKPPGRNVSVHGVCVCERERRCATVQHKTRISFADLSAGRVEMVRFQCECEENEKGGGKEMFYF